MSRCLVTIRCKADREKLAKWIASAPDLTRVELKAPKRSVPQSDRMWASLTDLAEQLMWHGQKLSANDWKILLLAGLKQEMRPVPNIDGNGVVNLGRSSSDLSRAEMSDFLEIIYAFGATHDVHFQEPPAEPLSRVKEIET